jgi:PilZ domain-containing protein
MSGDATSQPRKDQRLRVLKGAKIVSIDHKLVITCTIRNISTGGALIVVESPYTLPATFELQLANGGGNYRCSVVWRKSDRVGVRFEKSI